MSATDTLRIAVAQFDAQPLDIAANAAAHEALLEQAASDGAQLVVFPELSLTGYCASALAGDPAAAVVDPQGQDLAGLRAACNRLGVAAVVGAPVMEGGARYLASIPIDRRGGVDPVYRKVHLSGEEQTWFRRGRQRLAVTLDGWKVALGVCYDSSFPEHARGYARDGADLYLVSGAFPAGRAEARRSIYMPARALENTIYVAYANYVGAHDGQSYEGRSGVWGPDGAPVAEAGGETGLAMVTLRRAALAEAREALPMLRDLAALRAG